LGFEKVAYAHQYGLGELAGYDIAASKRDYPDAVIPENMGGVGKMCSLGIGISDDALQWAPWYPAIANGGRSITSSIRQNAEESRTFNLDQRQLDIAP